MVRALLQADIKMLSEALKTASYCVFRADRDGACGRAQHFYQIILSFSDETRKERPVCKRKL